MDDEHEWEDLVFDGELFVDDARQAERHPARVAVAFGYDGQIYRAHSDDISPGGLFVVSEQLLPIDREFKLVFKLPNREEPARAVCRVAWAREEPEGEDKPRGFGVQFLRIRDEDIEAIKEFVELRSALLIDGEDDAG